eukprot:6491100-Amphidinium_carterae.5
MTVDLWPSTDLGYGQYSGIPRLAPHKYALLTRSSGVFPLKKLDKSLHPSSSVAATQAVSSFGLVSQSLGDTSNSDIGERAKEVLLQAYVTMTSGVLLYHFKQEADVSQLRNKVQLEIKGLRAHGLNEKTVLNKLLLDKIWKAL